MNRSANSPARSGLCPPTAASPVAGHRHFAAFPTGSLGASSSAGHRRGVRGVRRRTPARGGEGRPPNRRRVNTTATISSGRRSRPSTVETDRVRRHRHHHRFACACPTPPHQRARCRPRPRTGTGTTIASPTPSAAGHRHRPQQRPPPPRRMAQQRPALRAQSPPSDKPKAVPDGQLDIFGGATRPTGASPQPTPNRPHLRLPPLHRPPAETLATLDPDDLTVPPTRRVVPPSPASEGRGESIPGRGRAVAVWPGRPDRGPIEVVSRSTRLRRRAIRPSPTSQFSPGRGRR